MLVLVLVDVNAEAQTSWSSWDGCGS